MLQEHISNYHALDFYARQVVEGFITGKHKSPMHGFSVEFSDYRQYNPGESVRNVDWHLYGRTDRMYVKQFEEETNLRCRIIIDHSGSMLYPIERHGEINHPNKITFSAYAAAVLIEVLHRQRDAFGLTLFSQKIDLHTECRSSLVHQRHLLGILDGLLNPVDVRLQQQHVTDLPTTLHQVAERIPRRSLVVIFTDAFGFSDSSHEALFDALRHLRHSKHEVVLFHTFDRSHELELNFDSRPYRFIDLESGRELRVQPQDVAKEYSSIMTSRQKQLQRKAMQYGVDYVAVDVEKDFHQVLLPFMLRRSKM